MLRYLLASKCYLLNFSENQSTQAKRASRILKKKKKKSVSFLGCTKHCITALSAKTLGREGTLQRAKQCHHLRGECEGWFLLAISHLAGLPSSPTCYLRANLIESEYAKYESIKQT